MRAIGWSTRARPAYGAGLRAAIATIGPLIAGAAIGGQVATWASIAGFDTVLVDRGGSYRSRARVMLVLVLALTGAVAAGTAANVHPAVVLPATFAIAVAGGLARSWGAAGASIGTLATIGFLIAVGIPAAPGAVPARALAVVGGGAWAMLVALIVWPILPYRPVRRAVAACYRALATYVDEVAAGQVPTGWRQGGTAAAMRAALEEARAVLGSTRRVRTGESPRGERLLVLHVIADQLFGQAIALADALETVPDAAARAAARAVLARFAADARAIADASQAAEPRLWERRPGAAEIAIAWDVEAVRARDPHLATIVDRIAHFARIAAATAASLDDRAMAAIDGVDVERPLPPGMQLRAVLAPSSVVRRHALRAGVLATVTVALVAALDLTRGYWVTITVIGCLQPYTGATTQRAVQRVAGTVLGGILTAAVAAAVHDERAILALATVSVAACVAVLPVSYAAFATFVTPTFVLLAEMHAHDWSLVHVRIASTLLGGGVALVGSRVLWPSAEARRLPAHLAAALAADRAYLREAIALATAGSGASSAAARSARRAFGVAAGNADESFQRMLDEHKGPVEALAPIMTVLTYTRRLVAATAALAQLRHVSGAVTGSIDGFAAIADGVLEDLAASAAARRPPAPFPDADLLDAALAATIPEVRVRAERIVGQLAALHDALALFAAGSASGG